MNRFPPLRFRFVLPLLLCFGMSNCSISQPAVSSVPPAVAYQFPYQLDQAEATFELPKKLVEISGLSLSKDKTKLFVIQDEDGIVFIFDKKTGEIVDKIPFGKTGDYEGVEHVNGIVYVVKSSGKIYAIKKPGEPLQEIFKYKTPLTKAHDVEGLGYDPTCNALLLACKGQPDDPEKELNFSKAIYHFHLDSMVLDSVPAMVINRQDVLNYFKDHPPLIKIKKNGEEKVTDPAKLPCYPSAIAVHPISGNYYITSSRGKVVFVTTPKGKLLHIEKLQKKIHPQPEGLAFDTDGTLYLSNEGDGGKGKIYRFGYQVPKNQ